MGVLNREWLGETYSFNRVFIGMAYLRYAIPDKKKEGQPQFTPAI